MSCLPPNHHRLLRSYFASGWAFLIPYQLAYLLYYWRQWPANPGTATAANTFIPSLLVVYWAMHALHLALGAYALGASPGAKSDERKVKGEPAAPDSPLPAPGSLLPAPRSPLRPPSSVLRRLAPRSWLLAPRSFFWLSLALLFYLPGVYLEFPSDPWTHLGRITEWQVHEVVHWHTAGYKSLYFFAYSLVGRLAPENLLFWLNLYHTGICLLLSWQYYRLARAVGLPVRWAWLFIFGHALLFGNVTFSFFRYYSLASTAFSQLGAIALIRLTITWTKNHRRSVEPERHREPTEPKASLWAQCLRGSITDRIRAIRGHISQLCSPLTFHFSLFFAALLLAVLIASNHVQGLGIAALGCASVLAWRLVNWPRRPWTGWLILISVLVVGSFATYHLWPRSPQFAALIPPGWITPWYGFSLLAPTSPAFDRMIQILGGFGLLNLAAGIYLVTRRQLAGWLTLFPVVLLALPLGAIPLADSIIRGDNIITYHRMFFAIPAGLALVALLRELTLRRHAPSQQEVLTTRPSRFTFHPSLVTLHSRLSPFTFLLSALLLLTLLPASKPWYNRFWHALARPPADLSFTREPAELARLFNRSEAPGHGLAAEAPGSPLPAPSSPLLAPRSSLPAPSSSSAPPRIGSTSALAFLLNLQQPSTELIGSYLIPPDKKVYSTERYISAWGRSPVDGLAPIWPAFAKPPYPTLLTLPPTRFFTPYSQAAQLSQHWGAHDTLFATTGMAELEALAQEKGLQPQRLPSGMILWKTSW